MHKYSIGDYVKLKKSKAWLGIITNQLSSDKYELLILKSEVMNNFIMDVHEYEIELEEGWNLLYRNDPFKDH